LNLELSGRNFLVTAASKGLGFSVARELLREGGRVMLSSSNLANLKAAGGKLEGEGLTNFELAVCDLADAASIDRFVDKVFEEFGVIDGMVTNCGGPPAGPPSAITDQQWQRAFDTIFMSVVRLCRRVVPHMIERRQGSVLAITSTTVKQPIVNLTTSNSIRPGLVGYLKRYAPDYLSAAHRCRRAIHWPGADDEAAREWLSSEQPALGGVAPLALARSDVGAKEVEDMIYQGQFTILGVPRKAEDAQTQALKTLGEFWQTYEISGVSLVDMAIWHWMYDHPDATPAELKAATLQISKDVWNAYFAPVFGRKDCTLLAVYSHIVHSFLYRPDDAVGHLIGVQVEAQIAKSGDVAGEVERMCRIGNIAPDLWMTQATGSPVGPEALLTATAEALKKVGK
jgi:NAD(P)-dependent dehydrogenase (short-subunit alcohol dehydrogenase family)